LQHLEPNDGSRNARIFRDRCLRNLTEVAYLLTCYDLRRRNERDRQKQSIDDEESIEILVDNVFGDEQALTVTDPSRPTRLCVPTAKEHVESGHLPGDHAELGLDSYLCYRARGDPRDFEPFEVSLADQFQDTKRWVKKPVALCNPVEVDGAAILEPDAQLTCYAIRSKARRRKSHSLHEEVLVSNAFGSPQHFTVRSSTTLCVPSVKSADEGPPPCSPVVHGEFGLCRRIIGWGIDSNTGVCSGISGRECDEGCEGRVFADEQTCLQHCGDP